MKRVICPPPRRNPTQVTVYAGGSGGAIHDLAPSPWQEIEGAFSTVLSIAAVVTGQAYLYLAAAALDAVQGGEDLSQGQIVPGIVSLAEAVSAGILGGSGGTTPIGSAPTAPLTSAQVVAEAIGVGAGAVGGVYGIVTSAQSGNAAVSTPS